VEDAIQSHLLAMCTIVVEGEIKIWRNGYRVGLLLQSNNNQLWKMDYWRKRVELTLLYNNLFF